MLVVLTVATLDDVSAETMNSFSRYDIILQRRPFGEAPSSDAGNTPVVRTVDPNQPSFADSLRLCAISDGAGATRVGFVDINSKPPKTYYLFVGDSEDGIEVIDADYEAETAILRKDGDERQLSMSGASGSTASLASNNKSSSANMSAGYQRRRERITRTREEIAEMRRLEIERKRPILQGDEYKEHIRQYNLNEIRMGGIPLPVALSPEDDAMLVAEGVLAPVE